MNGFLCRLLLAAAALAAGDSMRAAESALSTQARAVLRHAMATEIGWGKIHAAEALIAAGEGPAIRSQFLSERVADEAAVYRVGFWRVLAETAPSAAERTECIAHVESIFLNPASVDRSQALETLCKLRCRLTGPPLADARALADGANRSLAMLALWSLALADEPGAVQRLGSALSGEDPTSRQIAAYGLRWLAPADATVRGRLRSAADHEPAGSNAYAFLLSAALTLEPGDTNAAAWQAKLKAVQDNGTVAACWEASQALAGRLTAADEGRLSQLLESSDNDKRVGAALDLLTLRPPS